MNRAATAFAAAAATAAGASKFRCGRFRAAAQRSQTRQHGSGKIVGAPRNSATASWDLVTWIGKIAQLLAESQFDIILGGVEVRGEKKRLCNLPDRPGWQPWAAWTGSLICVCNFNEARIL